MNKLHLIKINNMELIDEKYSDNLKLFFEEYLPEKWKEFFDITKGHLNNIPDVLSKCTFYPPIERIFRVFYKFNLEDIKLVILGQDPYHNGNATGYSFEVKSGKTINPSLRNIYKEVENCGWKVNDKKSGILTRWANQGVFLYNTYLTVEEGNPESHSELWEEFSREFISYITEKRKNIIFMLWGGKAAKLEKYVKNRKEHKVIICGHPSPLNRTGNFIGSKCFSNANKLLKEMGKGEIDWSL